MIDFHTHAPAWNDAGWLGGARFGAEEFIAFMDSTGIEQALVLSHDGLFNATPKANDDLAAFVAHHPDRLAGFGTVHPRDAGAAAEVDRMLGTLKLRGLKLHPWLQGFSMHERALDPVCDVLAQRGGILLSHDGTPPYSTAGQIAALARRHPSLPVVLGHGGLHDTWRESLALTVETPNLYLCICGTPPYAAREILAKAPSHKVLFGTDAGLSDRTSQDYAVARVAEIDGWGITDRQRQAMLVDNPRALLGAAR
ncbi:amidohydrolase family protein [Sinosporangium siamense]|uniref:Metal-dependent hydrolase n=1 Tax=Sinosporangium siamense TaxID=1367973 RepID=A0A919V4W1_9ACTN|nr:amidohydrolase family protein [Sinosporangium siamense]GII92340.1 metal-dependent hydrolase [Sinosporangium siamense]